ncbi:endonuclease/exonuclease/phosphatase family protein [Lysobacter sp. CA199]|uniref:endonuclease/exonuclease/phosphatase family protein n=1 Tax=Lysobacter sp. CA199 TaxID=3455608 RepID=UPI003F8D07FF
MTPRSPAIVAATAAGGFVLLDSLRIWLPSLTTIFGSAGTTSAIDLAAFALAWVVPLIVLVPWAAGGRGRWLPLFAASVAVAARIVLQSVSEPQVQLYASSIAACASLLWLLAIAARGWSPRDGAVGVSIALAATTLMQLANGGVDLSWQPAWSAWPLLSLAAAIWLAGCWQARDQHGEAGAALWFAAVPALVLGGLITIAIGRTWTGLDWPPPWWGGALIGIAAMAGVLIALRGGCARNGRWLAPLLLIATALADLPRDGEAFPSWIALPQALLALLIPAALAQAAQARAGGALQRGFAAYLGLLLGFVLAVVYYVAFDMVLPIPRPAFVLAIAALVAAAALTRSAAPSQASSPWAKGSVALAGAASVAAAFVGAPAPPAVSQQAAAWPLRVMSYNIRYGISDDGRFDPDAIAEAIAAQAPDIVMLQEVDRGFLLNGSHDVLASLQRRLRMHVYYNPASEPLFGDAILSRWPLHDLRRVALPVYDVATRPGSLSGVLALDDGGEVLLAVSHLHEKEGGVDVRQVRDLAAHLVARMDRERRPLILAGDYNLEPSDPRLRPILTRLRDGLAAARPLPTWPAARPVQQLDYLFLSPELRASGIIAPATVASDHLPVVADIGRKTGP